MSIIYIEYEIICFRTAHPMELYHFDRDNYGVKKESISTIPVHYLSFWDKVCFVCKSPV